MGSSFVPSMEAPESIAPFALTQRIHFHQTDAAGLAHFSTYFFLMEAAEAALFRHLGLPLLQTDVESKRGYPRTEVNCRFFQPLHFDEEVLTELSIARLRASRISYAFTFKKSGGTPCAQGAMTTSFVERQADGSLHPQPLPENVITALQPYLGSG
jgi:acyl-CoA thioester hydrolase